MKRRRGRPKKFRGDKDAAAFPAALQAALPAVVEFIVEATLARVVHHTRTVGTDRRAEALSLVAEKYGISSRTLERRYAELRFLAEPIAAESLRGRAPVPLEIEFLGAE